MWEGPPHEPSGMGRRPRSGRAARILQRISHELWLSARRGTLTTQAAVNGGDPVGFGDRESAFPTAIEEIDGVRYVFYGMADAHIGVARLDRSE